MRPAGQVDGDDAWLLTRLPAPQTPLASQPPDSRALPGPATAGPRAAGGARSSDRDDPATTLRSADDSDLGWGGREDVGNDDRLRRDRPPHW